MQLIALCKHPIHISNLGSIKVAHVECSQLSTSSKHIRHIRCLAGIEILNTLYRGHFTKAIKPTTQICWLNTCKRTLKHCFGAVTTHRTIVIIMIINTLYTCPDIRYRNRTSPFGSPGSTICRCLTIREIKGIVGSIPYREWHFLCPCRRRDEHRNEGKQ